MFQGDELTLECAIYCGITTKVSKSEDFNVIMEGGCTLLCKSLLVCGHYCTSICHSYDRDHLIIKCREPCNKYNAQTFNLLILKIIFNYFSIYTCIIDSVIIIIHVQNHVLWIVDSAPY